MVNNNNRLNQSDISGAMVLDNEVVIELVTQNQPNVSRLEKNDIKIEMARNGQFCVCFENWLNVKLILKIYVCFFGIFTLSSWQSTIYGSEYYAKNNYNEISTAETTSIYLAANVFSNTVQFFLIFLFFNILKDFERIKFKVYVTLIIGIMITFALNLMHTFMYPSYNNIKQITIYRRYLLNILAGIGAIMSSIIINLLLLLLNNMSNSIINMMVIGQNIGSFVFAILSLMVYLIGDSLGEVQDLYIIVLSISTMLIIVILITSTYLFFVKPEMLDRLYVGTRLNENLANLLEASNQTNTKKKTLGQVFYEKLQDCKNLLSNSKYLLATLFFNYLFVMVINPVYQLMIVQEENPNSWFFVNNKIYHLVSVFVLFSFSSICGNFFGQSISNKLKISDFKFFILNLARGVFFVLVYMFVNVNGQHERKHIPVILKSNWQVWILQVLFGFTFGSTTTMSCLKLVTKFSNTSLSSIFGMICGITIAFGLFFGILMGNLYIFVVTNFI